MMGAGMNGSPAQGNFIQQVSPSAENSQCSHTKNHCSWSKLSYLSLQIMNLNYAILKIQESVFSTC